MAATEADKLDAEMSHSDSKKFTVRRRKATPLLLLGLTISMLGIGFAWAAQFARVPSLLEEMGLSNSGMSLAFLAGPICGLVVQPIVGTLSDTTNTRCGRRRPWMAASIVVVAASFLVIGDSYVIGGLLGDEGSRRPRGLALAVVFFWALDFAQNAVQLPCRTLVSDVLVPSDVALGNAMFALFDGVGKLVSYMLAATSFSGPKLEADEPDYATDVRVQFGIAALVSLACVGVTVVAVREPPPPPVAERRSLKAAVTYAWGLTLRVFLSSGNEVVAPAVRAYELVPRNGEQRSKREALERQANDVFDTWTKKEPDDRDRLLLDDSLEAAEDQPTNGDVAQHPELGHDDEIGEADEVDEADEASSPDVSLETLRRVCLIELGLWYGLSAWQVWGGILVGNSILGGTPTGKDNARNKFEAGILLFSLGLAGANLVSLVAAPVFPALLRTFGARKLFVLAALIMTVACATLACLPFLFQTTFVDLDADTSSSFDLVGRDPRFFVTVGLLAALGCPWAAHMNIPFSTVGRAYQDAPDVGLLTATLNTSLCIAQLAMSCSTAILVRFMNDDAAICFAAAALAGLFSLYHACKFRVPFDESNRALRAPPRA